MKMNDGSKVLERDLREECGRDACSSFVQWGKVPRTLSITAD